MPTVRRAPQAELDLRAIWLHIAQDSIPAAHRMLETIGDKCHLLAQHPEIGEKRPELAPNLRSFVVGNYVVFYRPINDGIEVARVVHSARDIGALF